jgi:hypothetical protein
MTQKKLIPKPLRGSKSPFYLAIYLIFVVKNICLQKTTIKWQKIVYFLKNGPKPIQAGY